MGIRSSVTTLPEALQQALDKRLLKQGFSGYAELAAWLAKEGHKISRSSVHRYGSRLQDRLASIREATLSARAIVAETAEGELTEVAEASLRLAQERLFNLLLAADSGDTEALIKAARATAEGARAMVSVRRARLQATEEEQARQRQTLQEAGRSGALDPEVSRQALAVLGLG